jgi:putative addiction module component (TIGR02574 family)
MGDAVPIPPPGFEALSIEEKIEYVQSLWDHIASDVDTVPLTEWQKRLLDERLDDLDKNPDSGIPWEEFRSELLRKIGEGG